MTPAGASTASVDYTQLRILGPSDAGFEDVLTPDALRFVAILTQTFSKRLNILLQRRTEVYRQIRAGLLPDFLPETEHLRSGPWDVGAIPDDLKVRRVEITGPVDRKMMINALNSGADVYMADFEDSHSPTWKGTVHGQVNLRDAVNRRLKYESPEGKRYNLNEKTATLCVRPRGFHLLEKHVLVDSEPVPAAFFDFGLCLYHNAKELLASGSGPYFYLSKLESHLEARLWNDVFAKAEEFLGLPMNSIKCSVLVENVLAGFEMHEILYELRNHVTALNLGRWDYIFSFIKKFGWSAHFVLPDRGLLTMTSRFLESCSLLLVQTCHKRGAYAIGGMAAQVPIRNNPKAQKEALEKVVQDKEREVRQGYDGAWVAHPGLVPVVMEVFNKKMAGASQLHVTHEGLTVTSQDLLAPPEGSITEEGVRANIRVSLMYLESWLRGNGCVAINNLMEDTATVEISRTQIWQWIRHESLLSDGRRMTSDLFRELLNEEFTKAKSELSYSNPSSKLGIAGELLHRLATSEEPVDFLPLVAYDQLDESASP